MKSKYVYMITCVVLFAVAFAAITVMVTRAEEPQDPPPPQVVVTEATSVTIEIGDRTEGFGKPALLWKEAPPYEVMSRFRSSATMKRRGMFIEVRDDGIYFVTGLTLFIR